MKKFVITATALSLLATPALAAPQQGPYSGRHPQVEHNQRPNTAKPPQQQRHNSSAHNGPNRGQPPHQAQSRPTHPQWQHAQHNKPQHRQWQRGERFDSRHASNYRMIDNPRHYHLNDAPRGYRWVSSGNDALLIGITSGIIAAVVAQAF